MARHATGGPDDAGSRDPRIWKRIWQWLKLGITTAPKTAARVRAFVTSVAVIALLVLVVAMVAAFAKQVVFDGRSLDEVEILGQKLKAGSGKADDPDTTTTADACLVLGRVFNSDTKKPFVGVEVGAGPDNGSNEWYSFTPLATTGPSGSFRFDCSPSEETEPTDHIFLRYPDLVPMLA